MSRKDYIAIAAAIRAEMELLHLGPLPLHDEHTMLRRVAEAIARACKADNPNFDFARFYSACGVEV